MFKSF